MSDEEGHMYHNDGDEALGADVDHQDEVDDQGDDDMAGDSPPKKSKPSRRDTLVDEEEEEDHVRFSDSD